MGSKFKLAATWPLRQLATMLPGPPSLFDNAMIENVDDLTPNLRSLGGRRAERTSSMQVAVPALPDEIWLYIFVAYLTSTVAVPSRALDPSIPPALLPIRYSPARMRGPFVLSAIYRRWRALALGAPELWTYIAVPPLRHMHGTASYRALTSRTHRAITRGLIPRWIALVTLLLTRSASASIQVVIPCFEAGVLRANVTIPEEYALHRRVVELVTPHFGRVRVLRAVPQDWMPPFLWTIIGTFNGEGTLEAPRLEELVLSTLPHSKWEDVLQPTGNVRLEAPRLRICILQGVTDVLPVQVAVALHSLPPPLLRLELSVTPDTLKSLQLVLGIAAATLEAVHLRCYNGTEQPWLTLPSPVVLSRVSHLGITIVGRPSRAVFSAIFALVEIPALKSVSFDTTQPHWQYPLILLLPFLAIPTNGAVEHLVLEFTLLSPYRELGVHDARMILHHLPSLATLTLLGTQSAIEFLSALHHDRPGISVQCVETRT